MLYVISVSCILLVCLDNTFFLQLIGVYQDIWKRAAKKGGGKRGPKFDRIFFFLIIISNKLTNPAWSRKDQTRTLPSIGTLSTFLRREY